MRRLCALTFIAVFSWSALLSLQNTPINPENLPWLTGPLIAPTGIVVPKGHYSIQPFLSFNANTGIYNSQWKAQSIKNFYNVTVEALVIVGLTKWMDFQTTPLAVYNSTQGESSTRFADLPFGFDFQLLSDEKYRWFPGIKLQLIETFPTGRYQKLNPEKLRTGISGLGSFYTTADLVFYKVYHIANQHYLSMTLSFGYSIFASTHVKEFNVYGGGFNTRGKVYPGNLFNTILSFEYTFNKNWVFAIDNVYSHTNKTRFSGDPGFIVPGIPSTVGSPSSEQLSFAPAIEYNFNQHLGLIAGSWFSAAGRNSLEFRSGLLSLTYYY